MARRPVAYTAWRGTLRIRNSYLGLLVIVPNAHYGRVTVSKLSPTGKRVSPRASCEWREAFGHGAIQNGNYKHRFSPKELQWLYSLEKKFGYSLKGVW